MGQWRRTRQQIAGAAVLAIGVMIGGAGIAKAQLLNTLDPFLLLNQGLMSMLVEPVVDETENPPGKFNAVKPQEFDPGDTHLVQAAWLHGIGCPTDATTALPNEDFTGVGGFAPYTDPACPMGDASDLRHEGLLLAKTGPTVTNFASATAELINVKGIVLTELGYDIRKQGGSASPLGSHCGAGAPRFNVITSEGFFGIGCNSPPANMEQLGNGWTRLRWGGAVPLMGFRNFVSLEAVVGTVQRIVIVFDDGQDPSGGPDSFGAAILDNIDVNGKLVGRGAVDAN